MLTVLPQIEVSDKLNAYWVFWDWMLNISTPFLLSTMHVNVHCLLIVIFIMNNNDNI